MKKFAYNVNSNVFYKDKFERRQERSDTFVNVLFVIAFLFVSLSLLFNFLFIHSTVYDISMQPTFNNEINETTKEGYDAYHDYVIVSKFNKGTNGDVVLLLSQENRTIIKRIIATAGQTVTLAKNDATTYCYYVNGKELTEDYLGDNYLEMDAEYFNDFCSLQGVEVGVNEASFIVPENGVFVLGDNRGHSLDSHINGAYDAQKIVGKVIYSYKYNETLFSSLWKKFIRLF